MRDILSVFRRKIYSEGLKTIGKWLSIQRTKEANGVVIFLMVSVCKRKNKQRKRYSDESQ